jgi:calcineurin-like phosphoesterase family protein
MKFEKLETIGDVYISSDIHYSHKNLCRGVTDWRTKDGKIPEYCTRDFKSVEKMNTTIVDNINKSVGQNDTLILLGDIAFGGYENIGKFLDRLYCQNIHLILGNHDQNIKKNRDNIQDRFLSVQDYLEVNINSTNFVLSHYPFNSWNNLNKGVIMLHGHVHLPKHKKFGDGKKMDVGLDGNDMNVYSINEIINIMSKRDIVSDIDDDHHLDDLIGVVG